MNKLHVKLSKILKTFPLCFFAILLIFSSPASALSSSKLHMFSQNNIIFYDPDANVDKCPPTNNGTWKGTQYTLTEEEIIGVARMAIGENNCNKTAFQSEVSLMANLVDKNAGGRSFTEYLTIPPSSGGWFATADRFYDSSINISDEYKTMVKDIVVNGNRTLPLEIVEHDCIASIDGCTNQISNDNGASWITVTTSDADKAKFESGKTWVQTIGGGSHWVFYQWAGGEESKCGDPFGYYEDKPPQDSYSSEVNTNTNKNYAGDQVWSDAELQAIEENKSIYQEAASQYNFPWQIMAVLHSLETSLRRYNPGNGQGVYQLYSYTDGGTNGNAFPPADSISEEEFRRQTLLAAEVVNGKLSGSNPNETDVIKRLFLSYNGEGGGHYEAKAIALGFSSDQIYEGSPYVMNRYDAKRDPNSSQMDPVWRGAYVGDGDYDESATYDIFGAFVKYEALGGSGNDICPNPASGTIAETAINLSWEGLNSHSKDDPKPEYVTAMKKVDAYYEGCDGTSCAPIGASCDQFVGTVMRYSGADPVFPIFGPPDQEDHILAHPEMYQKVEHNNDINNLQPGDIFITTSPSNHIYMYVGKINGVDSQASASFDDRTGEHYPSVYFDDSVDGGRHYNVYRRIGFNG